MKRKRGAMNAVDGPDMLDCVNAVNALWDDYKLHFRCTVVFRNDHWLFRGYAHDECSLAESRRSYQSYKRFEQKSRPEMANVIYFLSYDLYWQAQSDAANLNESEWPPQEPLP